MTQPLDKTTLVRTAWLAALRRQGHRQCHGQSSNALYGCALQLLAEVADGPRDDDHALVTVAKMAGLSTKQAVDVTSLNDGASYFYPNGARSPACRKHTFAEIADVVEGWFK